jgi:putative transcriptional regulator
MIGRAPVSLFALVVVVLSAVLGLMAPARAADISEPVILVAKPQLGDFYRSTILLAKPLSNGRHVGFIINRPTPMTLGKLFPEHGPSQKVVDPIYLGGPDNVNMIFAVVKGESSPGGRSLQLTDDLFLAMEVDVVDRIIEVESDHARFFAGLVAWQPGELQEEIKRGFWYVLDADTNLVLNKSSSGLWEELVSRSEMNAKGI